MNRSECDTSRLSDLIASGGKLFPGSQSYDCMQDTEEWAIDAIEGDRLGGERGDRSLNCGPGSWWLC
jgi:hypothetical protein